MREELFLLHLAAAVMLTGLIWFVQVVHYPLFARVGRSGFVAYEAAHAKLTSVVVVPAMLIEAFTAVALFWYRPAYFEFRDLCITSALLIAIWVSTFLWQVPQHRRLGQGFDAGAYRKLVRRNWLRTTAWSLRSIILVAVLREGSSRGFG